jgi:hypothetical protein
MSIMTAKKAAGIDFTIIGVILALVSSLAVFHVVSLPEYENPVDISTEMLLVNDFVEDYSYGGATLAQDEETGLITATLNGEVVGEITSTYLELIISDSGDSVTYSLRQRK